MQVKGLQMQYFFVGYTIFQPAEFRSREGPWKRRIGSNPKDIYGSPEYMKMPFSTLDLMYNINVNPLFNIVRRSHENFNVQVFVACHFIADVLFLCNGSDQIHPRQGYRS
jgi:hypothetical protein